MSNMSFISRDMMCVMGVGQITAGALLYGGALSSTKKPELGKVLSIASKYFVAGGIISLIYRLVILKLDDHCVTFSEDTACETLEYVHCTAAAVSVIFTIAVGYKKYSDALKVLMLQKKEA